MFYYSRALMGSETHYVIYVNMENHLVYNKREAIWVTHPGVRSLVGL